MKFGVIVAPTSNLGDDIQSLIAWLYINRYIKPNYEDIVFLNRENLNKIKSKEKIITILNGWYLYRLLNFPPSSSIFPKIISFHLTPQYSKLIVKKSKSWFKSFEPIGARDLYTLNVLQNYNIDAYFSGCLTLNYNRFIRQVSKQKIIVLVDIPYTLQKEIKEYFKYDRYKIIGVSHNLYGKYLSFPLRILYKFESKILKKTNKTLAENLNLLLGKYIPIYYRFLKALMLLFLYARSKIMITTRLHAALPGVSLGNKVVLISHNINDKRFKGYELILPIVSIMDFINMLKNGELNNLLKENKTKITYVKKLQDHLHKEIKNFLNNL